jgi:hypothetical protein
MKGVKDGIEGLPNIVLDIGEILHRRVATSILLGDCIYISGKFEGTSNILLRTINLPRRVLDVTNELITLN